jgi:hypothetical protein
MLWNDRFFSIEYKNRMKSNPFVKKYVSKRLFFFSY